MLSFFKTKLTSSRTPCRKSGDCPGSSRSRLPPSSAESTCPAIASHSIWRSWAAWAWTNLSAAGYRSTPLDSKVMELLKFCEKLTTRPGDTQRADIENLRQLGWNDDSIFDAVLVTSLFACANRFSAGLGLTPDFD